MALSAVLALAVLSAPAYAEQEVKITSKVFEAGGANAIQIASIERGS